MALIEGIEEILGARAKDLKRPRAGVEALALPVIAARRETGKTSTDRIVVA